MQLYLVDWYLVIYLLLFCNVFKIIWYNNLSYLMQTVYKMFHVLENMIGRLKYSVIVLIIWWHIMQIAGKKWIQIYLHVIMSSSFLMQITFREKLERCFPNQVLPLFSVCCNSKWRMMYSFLHLERIFIKRQNRMSNSLFFLIQ